MSFAHGPAKVSERNDFPPVGWGSRIPSWDERVRRWRLQPAKERRGCSLPRQRRDPTMLKVSEGSYGMIRWSNGHGVWVGSYGYSDTKCWKQGYWVDTGSYSKIKFIGASMEEVEAYLDRYVHKEKCDALIKATRADAAREVAMSDLAAFDQVLRTKVLDLIVDGLEDSP